MNVTGPGQPRSDERSHECMRRGHGNPNRVARKLVAAPPSATAQRKSGDVASESETTPRPPNAFNNSDAKNSDAIDPANVVVVPQMAAVRNEVVPLP